MDKRIWTPPGMQARFVVGGRYDCSRIFGLRVGRNGPGHDGLFARRVLIDLSCCEAHRLCKVFQTPI
jgi:hypothetical protein